MDLFASLLKEITQRSGAALWEEIKDQFQLPLRSALKKTQEHYKSSPEIRNGLDRWFEEEPLTYYAGRVFHGDDIEDETLARSFLKCAELAPRDNTKKMERAKKVVHVFVRNLREVALHGQDGLAFLGRRFEQRTDETHQRLDRIDDRLQTLSHDYGVSIASSEQEGLYLLGREELVALLAERSSLLQKLHSHRNDGERHSSNSRPLPLSSEERKALGILAASPIPPRLEWFEDLFPDRNWNTLIDSFLPHGFVEWDEDALSVPKPVSDQIFSSEEEQTRLDEAWIHALKPHRYHPDIATFLALKYLRQGNIGNAVRSLVDAAHVVEPGTSNDLLCSLLKPTFTRVAPEKVEGLSDHEVVRAYNALGLCLTRSGEHEASLSWFGKLRDYSRSVGDTWGIGQSHINSGVAHFHLDNKEESKLWYENASEHARNHGNNDLLGRALNNLASLTADTDPGLALEMLTESEELKRSEGDQAGLVTTKFNRGIIAVETDHLEMAEECFRNVVKRAQELDRRYLKALALHNLGNVLADTDRLDEALSCYAKAQNLAEKEDLQYPLRLALKGKGATLVQTGKYADAVPIFEKLRDLESEADNVFNTIAALHDLGVCLMKTGDTGRAGWYFHQSLRRARDEGLTEWIYRNRISLSITYRYGDSGSVISNLKEAAQDELEHENHDIAGHLWLRASEKIRKQLENSHQESMDVDATTHLLRKALKTFRVSSNTHGIAEAYSHLYDLYRSQGSHQRAIKVLDEAQEAVPDDHPEASGFEDERGFCLQRLGRYEAAKKSHEHSLQMSRESGNDKGVEASLNNLAELYRKTERPKQAVAMYKEAEELAGSRGDEKERLFIAHNRALALYDLGRLGEARDLMTEIRVQAEAIGAKKELARALHGGSILAWYEDPRRDTLSLFREAMHRSEKLGEYGHAIEAAVNYSSLLFHFDETGVAIRTLQPLEGTVQKTDLSHQHAYFTTLADAYERHDDLPNARSCWTTALQIGRDIGRADALLTPLLTLAGIDLKTGYLEEADQKIEQALGYASSGSDKAEVLLAYLGSVLAADEEPKIEAIQGRINELVEQHALDTVYIDMQMKIGDYYVTKNRRRHLEGCQHYAAALSQAMGSILSEDGLIPVVDIGIHIVHRLTSLTVQDRSEHLRHLLQQLAEWMNEEVKNVGDSGSAQYLLWPFRAARRLTDQTNQSSQLQPELVQRAMMEEFQELFPNELS